MEKYIVAHRPEESTDDWKLKESPDSETMEEAVRSCLTEEQIILHEWNVYKIRETVNKELFMVNGRFDDLPEF